MADQYERPYLDANVFLGWLKGENVAGVDRKVVGDHLFTLAREGVFSVFTSVLTLTEVYKLRSGPVLEGDDGDRILDFFEHDFFRLIDVDRGIAEDAHRFCRQFGIYPNDAIHLACALRARCDVLLAWDNRFTQVNHPGIRVEAPQIIGQQRLPGGS